MTSPLIDAVEDVEKKDPTPAKRILLTPQGEKFTQKTAHEFAECDRLLIVCRHYEGFDERIRECLKPREISLGDYVLSGGEPAAAGEEPDERGGEQAADDDRDDDDG